MLNCFLNLSKICFRAHKATTILAVMEEVRKFLTSAGLSPTDLPLALAIISIYQARQLPKLSRVSL